jgi:hypothetical protein
VAGTEEADPDDELVPGRSVGVEEAAAALADWFEEGAAVWMEPGGEPSVDMRDGCWGIALDEMAVCRSPPAINSARRANAAPRTAAWAVS